MTFIIPQNRVKNAPFRERYASPVFINDPGALNRFQVRRPLWLFNTPLHVQHQGADLVYTFVLTDSLTQTEAFGVFHLFVRQQNGVNPYRASFGSFEVAEHISRADFSEWLAFMEEFARQQGIVSLEIRHYPHCYHPSRSTFLRRGLLHGGFSITQTPESQFIAVTPQPFEQRLHASERRRLRKCLRAGFSVGEWHHPSARELYDFIQKNRQLLGYTLSFNFEQLRMWLEVFPDNFRVFFVKDGDTIASLTLTVRVGQRVLYNFRPADNLAYRTYSPSVLLTLGLYDHCRREDITVLDMGISVDDEGKPKPSLSCFKHRLGALDSPKFVFHKRL